MKMKTLMVAALATAVGFTACSDDDDITEGNFDRAELFAASNTSGAITVYDFSDGNNVEVTTLNVSGTTDNEGLFYDEDNDQLLIGSRSDDAILIAENIEDAIDGTASTLTPTVSTGGDLNDPRAIAVNGNLVVVADSDDDELEIYTRTGNTLTLRNTIDPGFPLWQIQFVGNDLYAVVDTTGDIAVFNNFLNNTTDADVDPTKRITLEGIVRTHGLVINTEDDVAIFTDIAEASNMVTGFDTDGGFHVIQNFSTVFAAVADGDTLPIMGNQVRVSGANTNLGNPVAASYDAETNTIFIAERANGGGRVLAFDVNANGNATPSVNNLLDGASFVRFYGED